MAYLSKNEIIILNTFKSLHIPEEILYDSSPFSCGCDLMVMYEELSDICDLVLKGREFKNSFIFDKEYITALNYLINLKDNEIKIFATLCKLTLLICKKYS